MLSKDRTGKIMPADRTSKKPQSARARMPAAHSLKGKVMKSLDGKDLQTTRALSQKLGLHQSSVSHTLKELMEQDLVVKKGKSYSLSNVGIIQRSIQNWMEKSLGCLWDHKEFFLSHDLSGIPQCFMVAMGVIDERRESIEKDPAIPFRMQEIIASILQDAKHIQVASSTLFPEHQLAAVEAVRKGASLQVVTSERIIQELRLKNYALNDNSLHGRIDLHCRNNINLHLIVTDSHFILALPRLDGTFDLDNIIICKDPEALELAGLLFYHYFAGSQKVDLYSFSRGL